ncbi:MAG: hypothetical protein OEV44_11545 [Spirochaetota bacterium]|nr:hypothetical protein [Spirochaetota bacterium]
MLESDVKKHNDICSHPCSNCNEGKLDNGEDCYRCGGTGCLDKHACELGKGLDCDN